MSLVKFEEEDRSTFELGFISATEGYPLVVDGDSGGAVVRKSDGALVGIVMGYVAYGTQLVFVSGMGPIVEDLAASYGIGLDLSAIRE